MQGRLSLLRDLAYGKNGVKGLPWLVASASLLAKTVYIFAASVDYPIAKQPSGHVEGDIASFGARFMEHASVQPGPHDGEKSRGPRGGVASL